MKTFRPTPELEAFYNALIYDATHQRWPVFTMAQLGLTIPARPTDPQQAAFFDHCCMPLYNLIKFAADRMVGVRAAQATQETLWAQQQSSSAP